MGKLRGFLEDSRQESKAIDPKSALKIIKNSTFH